MFKVWMSANPPDLHAIFKQLNILVLGEVTVNDFIAKRNLENALIPEFKENLQQYFLRVDIAIESLIVTHGIKYDDDELINRVMHEGLIYYVHLSDLLVPWRTGKEELPGKYSELMYLRHNQRPRV